MIQHNHVLGVDFGTSNSAAGYIRDGQVRLVEMAPGQTSLPTTFFFDSITKKTLMGEPANQALLNGSEGRFMRALKRVLGTSLMHEKRIILGERVTFVDIIASFLRDIKERAELDAGYCFDAVLSGRPVAFHGMGDPREAQSEQDLRDCYHAAGFSNVAFMAEPEAAAIANGATETDGDIGLIVDIGGGTSDFSLFQTVGSDITILANHGIGTGGTDFDRAISLDRVMPLFGKGSQIRKPMGPGLLPAPNALFYDLATWEKIPFLYTAKNRRAVDDLLDRSTEPQKLERLAAILEDETGHDLAFAIERGKINANGTKQHAHITLDLVERGLSAELTAKELGRILAPFSHDLQLGAQETMRIAGITPDRVNKIIYVGGSSLMAFIPQAMTGLFPHAEHSFSDVFSAVTKGLALAGARR